MESDSQDSRMKIRSQIENAFGKVVYSQTTQEKEIQSLSKRERCQKILQVIVSALASGSLIYNLIADQRIAGIIGSFLSFILLCLIFYNMKFDITSQIAFHRKTADELWGIREDYISLLTDFDDLSIERIRLKRDYLKFECQKIYSSAPRTSNKSYMQAQRALKKDEEQTFNEGEVLPFIYPGYR